MARKLDGGANLRQKGGLAASDTDRAMVMRLYDLIFFAAGCGYVGAQAAQLRCAKSIRTKLDEAFGSFDEPQRFLGSARGMIPFGVEQQQPGGPETPIQGLQISDAL